MGETSSRPIHAGIAASVAAFAVYLTLLNNFLRFEAYPLFRLEVLYTVLAGAVFAILFGMIYSAAGRLPKWISRIFRAILVAGLFAYAVGLIASLIYAVAAAAIAAALALAFGSRILPPIAVMALVSMLAASLGIGQETQAPIVQTGQVKPSLAAKPAIVHIVLDEHIGIEGLPNETPSTRRLKETLRSFYVRRNFRLFGGAYSQHLNTQVSLPFVLDFAATQPSRRRYAAKNNAYFRMLKRSGYRLNVLQSEYIDFCSELVDRCTTYQSQSYSPGVANAPLSASDKAILIGWKMIPSRIVTAGWKAYLWAKDAGFDVPAPPPLTELYVSPVNGLAAIRRLRTQLADLQPGQFHFSHILLPHKPYALRPDCSFAPVSQWRQGLRGRSIAERRNAYVRQILCTARELAAVLDAVERSPAAENAIVIVHGDHGSRISDFTPSVDKLEQSDRALVAWFSTLFAVRAPGMNSGYDRRHYPIADLLHELAVSDFRTTGSRPVRRPTVILADQGMIGRHRVALPEEW